MKHSIEYKASILWDWFQATIFRRKTIYAFLLGIVLTIVVFHLSYLPDQAAQTEVDYAINASSYNAIAENPLSLPHKLVSYVSTTFSSSVRAVRAVSIVFFGFCVVALYRILNRWHSEKIALFGATMFATNAIVLAVGRLGNALVLIFGWSIIISLLLWLVHGHSRKVAPFMLAIFSAGLLYVPGALYFFVLLSIMFAHRVAKSFKHVKSSAFIIGGLLGGLVIAPLVISFSQDVNILRQWLLIPNDITFSDIPSNILEVPSAFIYKMPEIPLLNVGQLPVFDVASGGLFLIGLYAYQRHIRLERTRIMLITALFSIILGALGQTILAVILLLPFVYSVIGAGISYVLDQWYEVFPRNPIARSIGLLVIVSVVLMSSYYQLTRFLVVWPQTPETREVYSQSFIIPE